MELAQGQNWEKAYLAVAKSFLLWCFTLTVCLLVVGFPVVVLMATVGVLSAIVLQSVLPVSAILVVIGGLIGANVLTIVVVAALLAFKGVHPEDVSWLHWLHGKGQKMQVSTYAACPLTCSLLRN